MGYRKIRIVYVVVIIDITAIVLNDLPLEILSVLKSGHVERYQLI